MKKTRRTVLVVVLSFITLVCLQVFSSGHSHVVVVEDNNMLTTQNKSLKSENKKLTHKVSELKIENNNLENKVQELEANND